MAAEKVTQDTLFKQLSAVQVYLSQKWKVLERAEVSVRQKL